MKPKVLLSTGSLYNMGLHRTFSIAERAGFKYLELMLRSKNDAGWLDTWDIRYLRKLEKEFGLKIASLHSPIDFEQNADGYFDDTIKLAKELKVNHVIFHIPKEEYVEYRQWFDKYYERLMLKSEITFLTENLGHKAIYQGVENFIKYPNFCFDTAHELKSGTDILKMVPQLPNIRQFHISWFDGKSCHMNILQNKSFFTQLLKLNQTAWRCLELDPKAFSSTKDQTIIKELSLARKLLEQI